MAIIAKCDCGKRTSVADSLAGGTIRCPACGEPVSVGAAAVSPAMMKANRQKAAAGATVSVSPGVIISAIVGTVLLVVVLGSYFGPWRVGTKWGEMKPNANRDVTDVVDFAIRAYESEHGMFDASGTRFVPKAEGDANFVPPMMAFRMPAHIIFSGKTNQGNYMGTYDTANGEVVADIEIGGMTVGGLVDVKKAEKSFHVTGREADGQVTAEADGHALQIVVRKPVVE